MIRNKWLWVMGAVVSLSVAAFFVSTVNALCPASCEYPPAGRDFYRGYFTNTSLPIEPANPFSHGALWQAFEAPWTVDTADEYISFMRNSLFDMSSGSVNNHSAAAAYVITTQLGYTGPDFSNVANGVNVARSRVADWEALIRDYDAAGLIIWNDVVVECPGDVQANLDYRIHDVYYYEHTFSSGCSPEDVITFLHPTTGDPIFRLKNSCGNPIGDNVGLPPVTPPPAGTLNPPTPPGPTAPPGYNPGDPAINSSCQFITGTAHDPAAPAYGVVVRITFSDSTGVLGTVTTTASTTSPYAYSRDTPSYVRNNIRPVTVSAVGVRSDGVTTFNLTGSPINIGPCLLATPNCGAMNVDPSSLDPGTPFTVTTQVRYGSLLEAQTVRAQPDFRYFIRITGPGGYLFENNNVPASGPDPATFTFTGSTGVLPGTGRTGTFDVGWGITGSFGAVNCGSAIVGNPDPPSFPVTNKPYFKVNSGDISAGAGISTGGLNCASGGVAPNPNASIVSWNRGTSGGYGGAGTGFGALALNHLLGFASGQGTGYVPSRLSFGNTGATDQVDIPQELYGGKYGSTACTADYFAGVDPGLIIAGDTTIPGQVIPNCTAAVPASTCRRVVYVNGDVHITGNIMFSGVYASPSEVPSFSLVVRGNIYIAPGVTQLDGSYIAQPTNGAATNGIIYTCAPAGFGTTSVNVLTRNLQNSCSTPLTVNGAFVGRQVWLLRTAGTLSGSTAAETFNYVPDLWMSAPYGNGLTSEVSDKYDAITSLPPVL